MKNSLITRGAGLWDPFTMLRGFRSVPDIDVKDETDAITVRADIPGIKKEDLDITVQQDLLTLKGERKEETEKKGKDYYHAERFYGAFSRTVELPTKVKAEGVKASYKDGVLEIRLPKDETAQARQTKIRIE